MDDSQVNQLLDEWEEQRESNPRLELDAFIEERLNGVASELIEAFRCCVDGLASIDRKLELVAGPISIMNQTSGGDSEDLRLSSLAAGLELIPGYRLTKRLGSGGFGEVWKAESPGGFQVALKFVEIGGRVGEIEKRSLQVIKDVRHPHLLSVFGTWQIGELLIIATELADRTLLDRFHEAQKEGHQGIPREELLVYLAEAAKGIDFLNDPGESGRMKIQHRDIKPQNMLLSGGSVKVGDFGLARSVQHVVTAHTGSLTFAYAAPECFDGITSSHGDQYSLAVTYCHLRGGRLPFDGTPVQIMEGHRNKQPDLTMIPDEEHPALIKALAKHPNDRWMSCAEFVRALESESVHHSRPPVNNVNSTDGSTKWVRTPIKLIFGVLILVGAWWLLRPPPDSAPRSESKADSPAHTQEARKQVVAQIADVLRQASSPAECLNELIAILQFHEQDDTGLFDEIQETRSFCENLKEKTQFDTKLRILSAKLTSDAPKTRFVHALTIESVGMPPVDYSLRPVENEGNDLQFLPKYESSRLSLGLGRPIKCTLWKYTSRYYVINKWEKVCDVTLTPNEGLLSAIGIPMPQMATDDLVVIPIREKGYEIDLEFSALPQIPILLREAAREPKAG